MADTRFEQDLGPYRWTLAEYVLRCEQGPDIREIVVEGELDRDALCDVLNRWEVDDVQVLASDYVAVSPDEIREAGFTVGVKGSLLTLAAGVERRRAEGTLRADIVIVVDRDYDGAPPIGETLLATDGYSIESYAFSEPVLERFVRLLLGRGQAPSGAGGSRPTRRLTCSGSELLRTVTTAGCSVAGVRLVLRGLDPPLALFEKWLDYVKVEGDGALTVRDAELLQNVLQRAGVADPSAVDRLQAERERAIDDPFVFVRGRDLICLLLKLLRSTWGRRRGGDRFRSWTEAEFARMLLATAPATHLDGFPLFRELHHRFVEV